MVNTKIRLIIFSAAKDGEALYSQQKQDEELTVAQIMNSLLPNSDLNWTEVCDIVQETGIKTIPKKDKCKKAKWLFEEALQIAVKRRSEKERRKGKIYPCE